MGELREGMARKVSERVLWSFISHFILKKRKNLSPPTPEGQDPKI
jgi:hypothetical protein